MRLKPFNRRDRMLVIASHPLHGHSMSRYSDLAAQRWQESGWAVLKWSPASMLWRIARGHESRKWSSYVDRWILGVPALIWNVLRADAVHICDHSEGPYRLIAGFVSRNRGWVVTCHDLIAIKAAQRGHTRSTGMLYQSANVAALRRAGLVLADSRSVAEELSQLFGIKAMIAPLSVAAPFTSESERHPMLGTPPYFLIVATTASHKNRIGALEIFIALASRSEFSTYELRVLRDPLTRAEEDLLRLSGLENKAHCANGVTDDHLAALYRGATALIVASIEEGFCWPLVEANACGTPAIAVDIPVIREVAGDANIVLPRVWQDSDITRTVNVLSSSREALGSAARRNAERFSESATRVPWTIASNHVRDLLAPHSPLDADRNPS